GGAQQIGVRLGADDHRVRLLRDVRDVREVIPVAMTDEDLIRLLHVRIDQRRVGRQNGVGVELVLQKPGREAIEPRIEQDGLASEADLPTIRAEPREVYSRAAGAPPGRRGLRALGDARQQQRATASDERCAGGEACPEQTAARNVMHSERCVVDEAHGAPPSMSADDTIRPVLNVLVTMPFAVARLDRLRAGSPDVAVSAADPARADYANIDVLYAGAPPRELDRAPRLKWVQVHMAGIDALHDHPLYTKSSIAITTTSGVHAATIAEYALTRILRPAHRVPRMVQWRMKGGWPRDAERWPLFVPTELRGATLGLIGYGSIGP